MSGLNDNADNDVTFDDLFTAGVTINPQDNTDEINPEQPLTDEKTTIVATDGESPRVYPEAEDLFGSPLIKNELPNFNSTFIETTKNNVNLIRDLVEAHNGITITNGISKEDAVIIDSLVPDLVINEKKPLGFYTEEKSKTQLAQTKATLSTEIEARIQAVGSGIMDFLDKSVEKYTPVVKSVEQVVVDKIYSLQLEIQSLSLQTNGKDINEILEFHPAGYRDLNDDEFNKFEGPIKQALIDLQQCFKPGNRSFSDKLSAIYYNQLYGINELYFPLGNSSGDYFKITDKTPFIEDINPEVSYSPNGLGVTKSLYFHSTLATGPQTLEQIKTLIGFIAGVITIYPTYKEQIKSIINNTELTKDKILDQLFTHSAANARDGLAIINIVNFLGDYICYLEKLKAVYSAIIETQKEST